SSDLRNDNDLRDVAARLWAMAVQIEDGNMSEAEQALRAAQDALRQALERGAPDEEIRNMIDRMERLARSGDKDAARRLLEQLQSMLENLQMAQPNGDDMGDMDDDMMSQLD